ncbi:MAG: hypothetical protein MUC69_05990, partial [Gemmatimonadales bacterium]|jgi:hypothetical protein|nr:hypothetical protein [Gemmatimonadales bacterium]
VVASLFLIGDAGEPGADDPVLAALTREAAAAPSPSIVFLGDNVYPRGLPAEGASDRATAEEHLRRQLRVSLASGARSWFVPGNHDWAKGGADGWAAIGRQEEFIAREGGGLAALLPAGGCPGPEVRALPGRMRLVLLDSQWWLHGGPRPTADCRPGSAAEVVDSLRRALVVPAGEDAVVVLHHPLRSHGPHGGYFTARQHLFPLTDVVSWLYLPLPVIGSLYPASRQLGISSQDLNGGRYEAYIAALEEALAPCGPRVVAAGHEHTLQVLGDDAVPTMLVSGTGFDDHVEPVAQRRDTRYAASRPGYMRIDRLRDGRLRLGVQEVARSGVSERHSELLPPARC